MTSVKRESHKTLCKNVVSLQAENVFKLLFTIRAKLLFVFEIGGDKIEKSITLAEQQSEDIEVINQVVFKMDEVTQHGAALLEQTAALARSLDERAINPNAAMSALELVGER